MERSKGKKASLASPARNGNAKIGAISGRFESKTDRFSDFPSPIHLEVERNEG
jgi:hypothetical protein